MNFNKTLCVILHFGSEDDTNRCIESLIHVKNLDIIISDNDPKQTFIPSIQYRKLVRIIRTGGEVGFSEGNNIGINSTLTYEHHSIFILNNDTIVLDGAFEFLRESLQQSYVGAVGPSMPYLNNPSKIWACGGYVNKILLSVGGIQPKISLPYEVDYLPGAAILLRSDLWRKIGGFNEKYFLAYEEAELCLEIKKYGFNVIADPRSKIFHKVGISSHTTPSYFYNTIRNRFTFSRYLYGSRIGFLYGILMTIPSLRSSNSAKQY